MKSLVLLQDLHTRGVSSSWTSLCPLNTLLHLLRQVSHAFDPTRGSGSFPIAAAGRHTIDIYHSSVVYAGRNASVRWAGERGQSVTST